MKKKCEKLYKEWLKYCYNIDKKKDPFHICNKLVCRFFCPEKIIQSLLAGLLACFFLFAFPKKSVALSL